MKYLMIVLLIAVIALIGWMAFRSRATRPDAMPAPDRPDALEPSAAHEPEAQRPLDPEPMVVSQSTPTIDPEPAVEPLPEPDPVVEPEPPVEPEPVVEPDSAGVGSAADDRVAATDPDEPTDPPQAVIDAGEVAAKELDPEAGWETDDDTKVHADPESGLYHTPDSPGYKLGPDGQVFESEDDARAAGFTRWDEPR